MSSPRTVLAGTYGYCPQPNLPRDHTNINLRQMMIF
jgi:hypothetical protein